MAKKISFDYEGDHFEGIARFRSTAYGKASRSGSPKKQERIAVTDVTLKTATGQVIKYNAPFIFNADRIKNLIELEAVPDQEPFYSLG